MFQSSPTNTQQSLFSSMINFLPEAKQRQLNNPKAWQNIFYEQITRKIPEEEFQPLFSDTGRPNASLRILVAMMILKEGYGWSDNELFDTCSFNLLIRQALGLNNMDDELPAQSTYYQFRKRLYEYQIVEGINLLETVFQELTRGQAITFCVIGDKVRMDSTLFGSNIAKCTRLQLIIACLQVFWNSLCDKAKARLDESGRKRLDELSKKSASQIIYRQDNQTKQAWLEDLGGLLNQLQALYSIKDGTKYTLIVRLLAEQYQMGEDNKIVLKGVSEITANSLQSPHDEDATYRKKKDQKVRGYSTNLTETCNEEGLNLVTDVQVENATVPDNSYVESAIEKSESIVGKVSEVSVDGAYYSKENDKQAEEQDRKMHYTGFPGRTSAYEFKYDDDGNMIVIERATDKEQQAVEYKTGKYWYMDNNTNKKRYLTIEQIQTSIIRQRTENLPVELYNRRCNVEASIFQMGYPLRQQKLKYRGKFRSHLWGLCRAAWINLVRIVNFEENCDLITN